MEKNVLLLSAHNLILQRNLNSDPINSIIHSILKNNKINVYSLYNMRIDQYYEKIEDLKPNIIGFNVCFSTNFIQLKLFIDTIKNMGFPCIGMATLFKTIFI